MSNEIYDKSVVNNKELNNGISEELKFRDYPTNTLFNYPYPENYPLNQSSDSIGWSIFAKNNSTGDFFVSEYIGNDTYNDYFQITRDGKVHVLENDFFVDNGKADVEFDIISNNGDLKILNGSGFISTENYVFNTTSTTGSLYVENDIVTEKGNVVILNGDVILNGNSLISIINDLTSRIETLENTP